MSHARVRVLFSDALAAYAAQKGIPVSFDNVKAKFEEDKLDHIKAHLIPADTWSGTLSGDHVGLIGMYQMTIVTTYGRGMLTSENLVDELQDIFKVNKMFTDTSKFSVQVVSPIHSPEGKQVDGQWIVPCYFHYRADKNINI